MQRHKQLGESGYRAHPYVANSTLSRMVSTWANTAAFRAGTLIHSVTLEIETVDLIAGTIAGYNYEYTPEEIRLALDMREAFYQDEFCRTFRACCEVEVEMYNRNTWFKDIALDTKRKYDLWNYSADWGGDIKSTAAESEAEFLHHVDQFDYDRGRVFYAAGSGAKRDVIIGISKKKPHRIFKVFMREGSPLWARGFEKCYRLAKMYHEQNPPF